MKAGENVSSKIFQFYCSDKHFQHYNKNNIIIKKIKSIEIIMKLKDPVLKRLLAWKS